MIDLQISFCYPESGIAEAVSASVAPENGSFVSSRLDSSDISFRITGNDAASVRATVDDLLACVKTAEASLGIVSKPIPEDDERCWVSASWGMRKHR